MPERAPTQPEPPLSWSGKPPPIAWELRQRRLWVQVIPATGRVVVITPGSMEMRSVAAGAVIWRLALAEEPCELYADEGCILYGAGQTLAAVSPESGNVLWSRSVGSDVSRLCRAGQKVFAVTVRSVMCLSLADGVIVWNRMLRGEPSVYPTHGGVLVEDAELQALRLLDLTNGSERWEAAGFGAPLMPPRQSDLATLPVSAHEAGLIGLDPADGAVRWHVTTERSIEDPPVVLGDDVLVADGAIRCIGLEDGVQKWQRTSPIPDDGYFRVYECGGTLLAETWRNRLLSLNPLDGTSLWEILPGELHGVAAHGDLLLLRVQLPGDPLPWRVICVDIASGRTQWTASARKLIGDMTAVGSQVVLEPREAVVVLGGAE